MHRSKSMFIQDIVESIDAIFEYVVDVELDDFKNDRKTYQAVIREFEIIGEAVKHIKKEAENCCPEIKWRNIVDFRNKINHEYFGVNFKIIWDTIFYELPKLKKAIEKLKKEIN